MRIFTLVTEVEKRRSRGSKNDPVTTIGELIDSGLRRRIESREDVEILDAFAFAEESSFPDKGELYTDVFEACALERKLSYVDAIREA
jgi:hypothetical protein